MAQIDIGGLPFAKVAQVIELLARDVLPNVQRALGGPVGAGAGLAPQSGVPHAKINPI